LQCNKVSALRYTSLKNHLNLFEKNRSEKREKRSKKYIYCIWNINITTILYRTEVESFFRFLIQIIKEKAFEKKAVEDCQFSI